jgi:hypothetical protein
MLNCFEEQESRIEQLLSSIEQRLSLEPEERLNTYIRNDISRPSHSLEDGEIYEDENGELRVFNEITVKNDVTIKIEEQECPICYEKCCNSQLECKHNFCGDCILHHAHYFNTGCPFCRNCIKTITFSVMDDEYDLIMKKTKFAYQL